jgi:hypothetical protein
VRAWFQATANIKFENELTPPLSRKLRKRTARNDMKIIVDQQWSFALMRTAGLIMGAGRNESKPCGLGFPGHQRRALHR